MSAAAPTLTPEEATAHAAALAAIQKLNSEATVPAAAPAKKDEPAHPAGAAPGAEEPAPAAASPELDARALADQLITAKLEAAAADFIPESRAALARLLRPHAALSKEGVTLGGKPISRENVLELLGGIAASLLPSKGVPGSGSHAPGEFRGSNPNSWLGSQEEFEKNKKDIRGRGLK